MFHLLCVFGSADGMGPLLGIGWLAMKIASVDPGGRTGLVTIEYKFRGSGHLTVQRAKRDQRLITRNVHGSEDQQTRFLYEECREYDVVVIEDFQLPAKVHTRNRELLSPVRIGFGLALLLGMSPKFNGKVVWQQPTQMGVITDDRLREWGLWLPGQVNKDIRSAMKHLIIYLRGSEV